MGIVSQALSVLNWHTTHQFCSNCGERTQWRYGGWRRDCLTCKIEHFPRINPVVIMLVTNGNLCLMGSGNDFSKQRYSCLAGFVEPGETIEAAAARELFEEAGVVGETAKYITSQPWPFPFNLMFGVHIETSQTELNMDPNELRSLKWFKKEDVKAVLHGQDNMHFNLPPKITIANTLLHYWLTLEKA